MRHVLLVLLTFFLSLRSDTLNYSPPYTLINEYEVDVEYPNIFMSALAFLGGIVGAIEEPSYVFYDDRVLCDSLRDCFEITVRTDEGKVWLFVVGGDTSKQKSFSELPRDKRTPLLPDAIDFVSRFRAFLNNPSASAFRDTFFYGDRNLVVDVAQRDDPNGQHIRYVDAKSVELERPDVEYVHATFDVYDNGDEPYYSKVFVHLKKSDVKITLSLANITRAQ